MHSIAIIGAGMMGNVHARAYKGMKKPVALWIVEYIEERARIFSERFGATITTLEEALDNRDIDIVDICTPTFTHRDLATKSFEAGKHVFCEKPVALNLADARVMKQTAEKFDKKFMVGHVVRFFHEYRRVKEISDKGDIGKIVMARLFRGGSFPAHGIDNWFSDIERSGGVFVDLSIHDFDFLKTLLGPVEEVEARSIAISADSSRRDFDHGMAILRFKSGAIAHVEGSWAEPPKMPVSFGTAYEFVGTGGMITNSYEREVTLRLQTSSNQGPNYSQENPTFSDPYAEELEAFVRSVDENTDVPVSGEDALDSLRIALAANLSARICRPVKISEVV